MKLSERRLPHWDVLGRPVFVTYRLYGSLPAGRVFRAKGVQTGDAFVAMDRVLDNARRGPLFLRRPDIAEIVVGALRDGESKLQRYALHAFAVMPNHVHCLVTPYMAARRWLGPLKGFTSYRASRILRRTGPFWQDESYDHLVRSDAEFRRIRKYIELNPVRAGLVGSAGEFPWSSAYSPGE